MQSTALLKLLHLVSPALPIGAFAYSQGLESAVEIDWVNDAQSCEEWIEGQLEEGIGRLDLPIFIRLHNLWSTHATSRTKDNTDENNPDEQLSEIHYWAHYLQASRESMESHNEEQQLGKTMARLLDSLDFGHEIQDFKYSYICQFSFACQRWNIPLEESAHGFIWSWLESQVTAASKIIPLGQTDAQKILIKVADRIPSATQIALRLSDDEIGSNLAGLAIASQIHETQYSRLFRS